jgi:hypothetical protein
MNKKFDLMAELMLDVKKQIAYQHNPAEFIRNEGLDPSHFAPILDDMTDIPWQRSAACVAPGPDGFPNPNPPPLM